MTCKPPSPWRFCVAPMIDWTTRECRFFHRQMSRHARLYSEMLTPGAVIFGDRERLLGFSQEEKPVVLQLGGSHPDDLAKAAAIAAQWGYSEINLNVGCPSDRVQNGRFGACLMAEPRLVGACVAAMKAAVTVPITVKCRIGIDDQDTEEALDALADCVIEAGVDALIVHARKAWLKGLSPKENRDIPPLDYGRVFRLKARHPRMPIVINGGISSVEDALALLEPRDGSVLDGVMLGRAAYQDPWRLMQVDPLLFGTPAPFTDADDVLRAMEPYIAAHLAKGGRLSNVTRHMLGLYHGVPGARQFRRHLATEAVKAEADMRVLHEALLLLKQARGKVVLSA